MEYQLSNKFLHADDLSRLIAKNAEMFVDIVIAALKSEIEIKNILCNVVRKLPDTLEEIKVKAEQDMFILKIKNNNKVSCTKSNYYKSRY